MDIFPSDALDQEEQNIDEEGIQNGNFIKHYDFDNVEMESLELRGSQYVFEIDHDFVSLKKNMKPDFQSQWDKCLANYLEGNWSSALQDINTAQNFYPMDGPCRWMKDYMDSLKFLAPENWSGVRDIDKKMDIPEFTVAKDDVKE